MYRILGFFACIVISAAVSADVGRITNADASTGLKQALADGSAAAVARLGAANGFLSNPKVKIPLPPVLREEPARHPAARRRL